MDQVQVGKKVRELRTSIGLTQEELAAASGLTVRSIQRIEAGKTIPRGDSIRRLALVLDVPVESLTSDLFPENVGSGKMPDRLLDVPGAVILSAFSFLVYPLLGVVFPMLVWVLYKNKIEGVQEIGLKVIRLEALWCGILACVNAYLVVRKLFHLNVPVPANVKVFAMLNVALYTINSLILVIYFVQWLSLKRKSTASFDI